MELCGLTLGYGDRILFSDARVGFGWGEFTALIGRNGTGKSTLLRTIAGLARPLAGDIRIEGTSIAELRRRDLASRISFVSTEEIRVANFRVGDVVALGRSPYTNWIGRMDRRDKEIVVRSLDMVGMTGFFDHGIHTLSDGERQRVMIARALAQDTPIILLDEPTAFLDLPNRYEICILLKRLAHQAKKSIVFSTHDLGMALEFCDTIALIENGQFHYGTADKMIGDGIIGQIFEHTQVEFDNEARTVRLRK